MNDARLNASTHGGNVLVCASDEVITILIPNDCGELWGYTGRSLLMLILLVAQYTTTLWMHRLKYALLRTVSGQLALGASHPGTLRTQGTRIIAGSCRR